jgi:hypothetical protein
MNASPAARLEPVAVAGRGGGALGTGCEGDWVTAGVVFDGSAELGGAISGRSAAGLLLEQAASAAVNTAPAKETASLFRNGTSSALRK